MRRLSYVRAAAVSVAAAVPTVAQETSQHLNDRVYISDIWEHKIIVNAPVGFADTDEGYWNLLDWANWGCRQYGRTAIGPINREVLRTDTCKWRELREGEIEVFKLPWCDVHFMYICASN